MHRVRQEGSLASVAASDDTDDDNDDDEDNDMWKNGFGTATIGLQWWTDIQTHTSSDVQ